MRGDSGIAGEGRVVGVPKFHSWGKYTMPLRLRDTVESASKINNAFHHKTCMLRTYVGFLLDCCTNLPPSVQVSRLLKPHAHFVN